MASSLTRARDGICLTCRHASACVLAKSSPGGPLECEEFELAGAGLGQAVLPAEPAAGQRPAGAKVEPEILGLCQNCRLRGSCRLPRPEGGIWFCEEYEIE